MAKQMITFSLDTDKDKRLLRWLESLPKGGRSRVIRETLTANLGQNGVTHRDIYEAIRELKLSGVTIVSGDNESQQDVPADVLANLSNLGL